MFLVIDENMRLCLFIMRIGDDQIEKKYIIEDNTGQEVQIKSIEAINMWNNILIQ